MNWELFCKTADQFLFRHYLKNISPTDKKDTMTNLQAGKIKDLKGFNGGFSGEILLPSDDAYESARQIWNAMIDKRPAIIARCATTSDVVRGVNFARDHGLLLAVRGGGHHIAGNALCDDGLVIDLSKMKAARVDPAGRRVTIEGGATLADLDAATQAHGLATPVGINSTTGIAGLTLGGGFGWLSRKYGMTIDNLESAEVVTAAGEVVRASATEHPDLFWALRGGGGNFGVVTRFEFRLHPVGPDVLSGLIVYPISEAKRVLQQYREFLAKAPEELAVWTVLRQAPPLPFLPEEVHGKKIIALALIYAGDPKQGEPLIEPLRKFGIPLGEHVGIQPYVAWQQAFDPLLRRRPQLLEVPQFFDTQGRALRRRHRIHRDVAVPSVRDLFRRHRRGHHQAGPGLRGLCASRRHVRHERPRSLGGPGRRQSLHRLGTRLLQCLGTLRQRRRLCQFPHRRRRRSRAFRLWIELRSPRPGEAYVRPGQPLSHEPEYPAGLSEQDAPSTSF